MSPNKIIVNHPCIVCGGSASEPFIDLNFKQFGYPGKFHLRRCSHCCLIFNSPRLRDEELDKLYDNNYYFFSEPAERAMTHVISQYLRSVALLNPKNAQRRLVEIGSAKGYQLALLQALGWDVLGIELSTFAATFAQRVFNVKVFNGTIESFVAKPHDTVDVAVGYDVIEHVLNPDTFVAALSRVVKTGGTLILDTPNANAKHIAEQRELWSGFIPFHIYFFNTENLSLLLERHGFQIERAFTYNNYFQSYAERKKQLTLSAKEKLYVTLGLHEALAKLKSRLLSLAESETKLQSLITQLVATVQNMPNYLATSDATEPLALTHEGENLVVVARKL